MSRRATIASKPPRADAQRNYRRLVEVAAKFFTEKGPEAPMEEVARRARVGIGTLYRHFPTRYDLLETVYAEQIEALIGRAQELKDSLPPGPALFAWLQAEAEHMMSYRALKVCLQSLAGRDEVRRQLERSTDCRGVRPAGGSGESRSSSKRAGRKRSPAPRARDHACSGEGPRQRAPGEALDRRHD